MPVDLPGALLDAGGWVFAAVTLSGVVAALIRGDLVPGSIYQREIERANTATEQLERQNDLGERLTTQVETLIKVVGEAMKPRS